MPADPTCYTGPVDPVLVSQLSPVQPDRYMCVCVWSLKMKINVLSMLVVILLLLHGAKIICEKVIQCSGFKSNLNAHKVSI